MYTRRFRSLSIPTKRALRNYVEACYQSQDVPCLVPEMATIREIAMVCTEWDTLWDREKEKENTTMYVVWYKSKEIALVVTQISCSDNKLINSYILSFDRNVNRILICSLRIDNFIPLLFQRTLDRHGMPATPMVRLVRRPSTTIIFIQPPSVGPVSRAR